MFVYTFFKSTLSISASTLIPNVLRSSFLLSSLTPWFLINQNQIYFLDFPFNTDFSLSFIKSLVCDSRCLVVNNCLFNHFIFACAVLFHLKDGAFRWLNDRWLICTLTSISTKVLVFVLLWYLRRLSTKSCIDFIKLRKHEGRDSKWLPFSDWAWNFDRLDEQLSLHFFFLLAIIEQRWLLRSVSNCWYNLNICGGIIRYRFCFLSRLRHSLKLRGRRLDGWMERFDFLVTLLELVDPLIFNLLVRLLELFEHLGILHLNLRHRWDWDWWLVWVPLLQNRLVLFDLLLLGWLANGVGCLFLSIK